jgi:hypothetical protein
MERINVAVITAFGTSGSKFLQGLFDPHEEVAVLPTLVNVYDFYDDPHEIFSPEEYLAFFEKNNIGLFNLEEGIFCSALAEPPERPITNIDRTELYRIFSSLCEIYGLCGRKEYFVLLHIAFYLSRGRKLENLKCLLVHVHTPYTVTVTRRGKKISTTQHAALCQDFPDLLFIPCLRDPVSSADAILGHVKICEDFYNPYEEIMRLSCTGKRTSAESAHNLAYMWASLYDAWRSASRIYLFRWEDMHRDFDGLFAHLCSYLGIQYDPTLRQATFFGNPWVGRSGKQRRTSCDPKHLTEFHWDCLTEPQRALSRIYFRDILKVFFPSEVRPFWQEVSIVLKGFFLAPFKKPSSKKEKKKGPGLGYAFVFQSWRDPYHLTAVLWEYVKMKRFRSLDISRAASYKSSDA